MSLRKRSCSRERHVRHRKEIGHNPVGVDTLYAFDAQGSSCLATLGFETKSRRDFPMRELEFISSPAGRGLR
jgi:hypothetical protein